MSINGLEQNKNNGGVMSSSRAVSSGGRGPAGAGVRLPTTLWIFSDIHVELTRGLPAGNERPAFAGAGPICDYSVYAIEGANTVAGTPPRMTSCVVEQHDRRQAIWPLIEKACQAIMAGDPVEF
jgi:hypothetical protein